MITIMIIIMDMNLIMSMIMITIMIIIIGNPLCGRSLLHSGTGRTEDTQDRKFRWCILEIVECIEGKLIPQITWINPNKLS